MATPFGGTFTETLLRYPGNVKVRITFRTL